MKILLVSATYREIEGVYTTLETRRCLENNYFRGFVDEKLIDILITGVGAPATAEILSRRIQLSQFDFILNVGICGSFRKELTIGTTVIIEGEIWGDIGAEDHDNFLDLFDLKILESGKKPFFGKELINPGSIYSQYVAHLPHVKGITLNKAHGNKVSIEQCVNKYNPDVESMESAAIFSICISQNINFLCLRSISNFVMPRNLATWNIELALKNLSKEVNRIINVISK